MDPVHVRAQFDPAAAGYGGWHRRYAERLVELTPLRSGDRVLDAGTGTGFAAFAAARVVGDGGSVVGVDLAEAMVAEAERIGQGVPNVSFVAADAARLPFEDARFDAVICSSAIIYMPMPDALREWRRVLLPGGAVSFSTLDAASPRLGVIFREVAAPFGVQLDNPNGIGAPDTCRSLLEGAGFREVSVTAERIAGDPSTPETAWRGNVGSAAFALARVLPAADLERMHRAYVEALTSDDLSALYGVLFAVARSS